MAEILKVVGNGFDPEVVGNAVKRVESLEADILAARMKYMSEARAIKGDINIVMGEAKDAGIPKKELKAVLRSRALERRAAAARDDLEDSDSIDTYDQIRLALGDLDDTPLGQAALAEVQPDSAQ